MLLRRHRSRNSGLEGQVEQLAQRLSHMEAHAADAVAGLAAQQRAMEGLDARIANLERARQIWSTMVYVRDAVVDEKALVSVVLATRNRSQYLPRAIGSVLAQTYPKWELLAVDDGSDDDTYEVVRAVDDERIRCFHTPHRGVAAARNHALTNVSGDYVAYIDDDNTMHPDWLRSIVWAFTTWPETECLYGAVIMGGVADAVEPAQAGMPWLWFAPFNRDHLGRENLTDIGAVAHRAGLPEAVFDEDLTEFDDWDLLLRMATARDLLALPVVAETYSTSAPNRLSGAAGDDRSMRQLRRKHALPEDAPDANPGDGLMASAPKVLMVALDACDYRLMLHLAAEGQAPTMRSLLEGAAQVGTSPPFGLYEGAIWPSLFTARAAEKHGFYCHEELDVGTYDHRATSPHEINGTPFGTRWARPASGWPWSTCRTRWCRARSTGSRSPNGGATTATLASARGHDHWPRKLNSSSACIPSGGSTRTVPATSRRVMSPIGPGARGERPRRLTRCSQTCAPASMPRRSCRSTCSTGRIGICS
jgi:Glycosyl transferase family 2